jgi:hypothetical protein
MDHGRAAFHVVLLFEFSQNSTMNPSSRIIIVPELPVDLK